MATSRRLLRKADVAWVETDDRVALLDLDHLDRPPVVLEGSSIVIWELLADAVDEQALVESVAATFHVAPGEVAEPVRDFVRQLEELSLLVEIP